MTRKEDIKNKHMEEYASMVSKLCPFFKEKCLMEKCMAFAGHCDLKEDNYNIVFPRCLLIIDTSMRYELAELGSCHCSQPQEPRWHSIDHEYPDTETQRAIDRVRKASGLKEDGE